MARKRLAVLQGQQITISIGVVALQSFEAQALTQAFRAADRQL